MGYGLSHVQGSNVLHIDELGFSLVDLDWIGHTLDYFILPSQAKQVFYVKDQPDNMFFIVCSAPERDT